MASFAETVQTLRQQAADLFQQERFDDAAAAFLQVLQLQPGDADAQVQLGNIRVRQERYDEAIRCYQRALEINPGLFIAQYILAIALHDKGRYEEAETHYRHALRIRPNYAEAHHSLGLTLLAQGRLDEAADSCRQSILLSPHVADAYLNLGSILQQQGKFEEAISNYQHALRLNPALAEAWQNAGTTLKLLGKFDEALECIERALLLLPGYPLARWNHAVLLLLRGDFERGWPEYESRWTHSEFGQRIFAAPQWDGSPLGGRTVLLYTEQGLGDTLQFIRYIPLVRERGGRVILHCQPALLRLLKTFPGIDRLEAQGAEIPPIDFHAPLLSLPGVLHTTLATIPAQVPYLQPDAQLVDHWQAKLATVSGFKVGIAWQGNPTFLLDRLRSFELGNFARLAELEGVRLISLQKGPGTEQLAELKGAFSVIDLGTQLDEASGAFMDTAAIMKCLDLVISSDTVVPHLAGALGVPVWVALPFVPDWRWLLQREDSPWYPTMRLFRQRRAGDWDEVFQRIAEALARLVSSSATSSSN